MLVNLDDLEHLTQQYPKLRQGCIVDTNVLFAASYGPDVHNEWAEALFSRLAKLKIPTYTNINIRSEFIELNRRVLLAEGLLDFYEDNRECLRPEVVAKLKSLRTRKEKAAKEDRIFKLSDTEIKTFRQVLSERHPTGPSNWEILCDGYFSPYLRPIWETTVRTLGVQFLGTRAIETAELFRRNPNWEDMIDIVGRFGIGSTDAMIINLYLSSTLSLIATTDRDVSETTSRLALNEPDKFTLVAN